MKAKLWIVLLAVGATTMVANGQIKTGKELLKEEKIAYINDYCKFSEDEAKKFWALEEEMQGKLKDVRKSMRRELKDIKDKGIDNMTDAELKKAFDNRKTYEQKLQDLKWEYNDKFITTVGVKKTAKYYEAEISFRQKLLERLKGLKMDGKGEEDEDN